MKIFGVGKKCFRNIDNYQRKPQMQAKTNIEIKERSQHVVLLI